MKLDNTLLKKSLVFGLLIAVVVWLSLLTQKSSQHNQTLITLNQKLASNEANINYQRVNEKLAELSEQIDTMQNNNSEGVTQSQLSEVQDELRSRVQLLSEQFGNTVSAEQLQTLQRDMFKQLATLNEQITQLSTKFAEAKNEVPKVQSSVTTSSSNKPKTTAQTVPFVIQGKELRAGEWVISVLPVKQKTIESSVLLTIGQSFGSWQLLAIEDRNALFKVGNQKRRLAIPKL